MVRERVCVAYLRSFNESYSSIAVQKTIIEKYSLREGIKVVHFFQDLKAKKRRNAREVERGLAIGLPEVAGDFFPHWEEMIQDIRDGLIGCVLVDTVLRLYKNIWQKEFLYKLCKKYGVKIIECGLFPNDKGNIPHLVMYHYSNKSEKRPRVVAKEIDALYQFASQRFSGWEASLYLDLNNSKSELDRALATNAEALMVKNFFYINRHTLAFLKIVKEQQRRNKKIVNIKGRFFQLNDEGNEELLSATKRVAIYDRCRSDYERDTKDVLLKKFKIFSSCMTGGWDIKDIYVDESNDNLQPQLRSLLEKSKEYDLVIVDTFGKISEDIIRFENVIEELGIPIYSLREGEVRLNEYIS